MTEKLKFTANNLEETDKIAKVIAEAIKNKGVLICLYGDIGAGKTTLVKSIAKYLGIKNRVTSPSFVILNEYHTEDINLYHFDLYRLEEEGVKTILEELREYTENPNAVTVIEWAQFSHGELPEERLEIQIKYIDENTREFAVEAFGQNTGKILEEIAGSNRVK